MQACSRDRNAFEAKENNLHSTCTLKRITACHNRSDHADPSRPGFPQASFLIGQELCTHDHRPDPSPPRLTDIPYFLSFTTEGKKSLVRSHHSITCRASPNIRTYIVQTHTAQFDPRRAGCIAELQLTLVPPLRPAVPIYQYGLYGLIAG